MSAFDHILVFGDSLSDNGNAGRASNGPVWVEYLAERFGRVLKPSQLGGTNYAVGGARLDPHSGDRNLRAQADLYLRTPRPNGRTLHIVYGGANDVLNAIGAHHGEKMIAAAVESFGSIVADLARSGATDVLVPNLPDVGITPVVRARGPQAVEEARRLVGRFNAAFEQALSGFAQDSGIRLHRLDIWQMGERVQMDPAAFGFADVINPCGEQHDCDGYLFWDDVHPTTRAHQRMAEAAVQVLVSP